MEPPSRLYLLKAYTTVFAGFLMNLVKAT